uniref:Zinc finger CCCH domain-containing protein 14 n=1 Tax=Panagrolaimus sp. PS1159 TaxID=55785 RepID=A0AC35EUS1_9BILA
MTENFADKANKGRCLAFPGYCDKTINTCNLAHPLINCDRYPACFNLRCTYLHPVCNFDCNKQLCKKINCKDFHPWRDSYRTQKSDFPNPKAAAGGGKPGGGGAKIQLANYNPYGSLSIPLDDVFAAEKNK